MKKQSKPAVCYIALKNIWKTSTGAFIPAGQEWPADGAPEDEIIMHIDSGNIRVADVEAIEEAAPVPAQED